MRDSTPASLHTCTGIEQFLMCKAGVFLRDFMGLARIQGFAVRPVVLLNLGKEVWRYSKVGSGINCFLVSQLLNRTSHEFFHQSFDLNMKFHPDICGIKQHTQHI